MTHFDGYRCDGCKVEVTTLDANGWLTLGTLVAPGRPEPKLLHATFCSLDCLVEWSDEEAFKPEPEPEEPEIPEPALDRLELGHIGRYL